MATQIFPMRERMKWVEATAGPSWTLLPLVWTEVGAELSLDAGAMGLGAETLAPFDLGPLTRGGAVRATAVAAFIPVIDAY